MSILVLGIGNRFMSDDAVGVMLIHRLQAEYRFLPEVMVVNGGTAAISLLTMLEGIERLLVVDAIDTGCAPGTVIRLSGDDLRIGFRFKISSCQIGVEDMLAAAKLLDYYPREVAIWGVQPAVLECGAELSPFVEEQFDTLLERVLEELSGWGVSWVAHEADMPEQTMIESMGLHNICGTAAELDGVRFCGSDK
ncbi:MAG TPA: HyaD/HybD family hydrogenase maturation endopeptidase [Terriglobia bacterium]|nr:HyaD/HybD family hydrogenase maturation endopeptidase [Terriglobia bacterium]